MAVITISRGSYSMGKTVAEQVAQRLGYIVISRDLLLETSARYHIPEIKLVRAIHDAPGILERLRHSKQAYLAYIRAALTERVSQGNVVYHGLAGHIMLKEIPGVLKVRINADLETRVAREMAREGISAAEARAIILKDDQQRRRWTKSLHKVDPWDSDLYDLVIRIDRLTVEDAVNFICGAAQGESFNNTPKSLAKLQDLALACRIKAELVEEFPSIGVTCQFGNVIVYTSEKKQGGAKLHKRIEALRKTIQHMYNIEIHSTGSLPSSAV
ncbi:MAG: cytidylate kinase-like family protein [Desulfobacteraceae bacterium]|nr:MAG: cytidylate kinase-like family protein [Desulfobacteraceae bacterium]